MNRKLLKRKARKFLIGGGYFKGLLYSIVIWLLGFGFINSVDVLSNRQVISEHFIGLRGYLFDLKLFNLSERAYIIFMVLSIFFRIFITSIIKIAMKKYFIKAKVSDEDEKFLGGLEKNYGNIIGIFLLILLIGVGIAFGIIVTGILATESDIILGILTIIMIGIIYLLYRFYLTFYILADNPDKKFSEILMVSEEISKGYRFEFFKLDLSLIVWSVLGLLLPGFSILVLPYMSSIKAEVYKFVRDENLNEIKRKEELEEKYHYNMDRLHKDSNGDNEDYGEEDGEQI